MRGSTRVEILKLLRLHEGLSRADLAEALKMNRGNISRSVGQMLEQGWLLEKGIQPDEVRETHRGQPPTRLEIHPDAFYALGLSIADEISISMVNALGEEVCSVQKDNRFGSDAKGMLEDILTWLKDQSREQSGRSLGLGVVSSGNMRKDAQHFFDNHYLGSSENANALLIELEKLGLGEVVPELIGNVYPLAEVQRNPQLRKGQTLFCLTEKLDLGILWEGRMLSNKGTKRLSIKHFKVQNNSTPCFCGKSGCLITVASIWSMMDRLKGYQPGTRGEPELGTVSEDRQNFYQHLQNREERVVAMVEIASKAIYEVLENLLVTFQPDHIFLPSWLNEIPEIGIDRMRQWVHEYATSSQSGYVPNLEVQSFGRAQASLGAGQLIIERHYGQISPYKRTNEWAEV